MATIRIADTAHPAHPKRHDTDAISQYDGVYSLRSPISRTSSRERERSRTRDLKLEAEDDDPGLRQAGDFKEKQVRTQTITHIYVHGLMQFP